jgi:predicted nucleotide-binding protein (sugar kinase/HSP70/actin superfamily)
VVKSSPATAAIVNRGVKLAVPEICVPIKIYTGHMAELLASGLDLIYIPRPHQFWRNIRTIKADASWGTVYRLANALDSLQKQVELNRCYEVD